VETLKTYWEKNRKLIEERGGESKSSEEITTLGEYFIKTKRKS